MFELDLSLADKGDLASPRCSRCVRTRRECKRESFAPGVYKENNISGELSRLTDPYSESHGTSPRYEQADGINTSADEAEQSPRSSNISPHAIHVNSLLQISSDEVNSQLPTVCRDPSPFPLTNRRHAILFRHFIEKWGPLLDVTVKDEVFGKWVPERAEHDTLLFYSILATASRHSSYQNSEGTLESEELYSKSLSLLIAKLSNADAMADENVIASAVILRGYEEWGAMDAGSDAESHLLGVNLYLNDQIWNRMKSTTVNITQGAFWVFLRQDLFTGVQYSHPLRLKPQYYQLDEAYNHETSNDHCVWANHMLCIIANIVNFCFDKSQANRDQWLYLDGHIERWRANCPPQFTPYYYDSNQKEGNAYFPEICLLHIWHVTGLQMYHFGRILLTIHDPEVYEGKFLSPAKFRRIESVVLDNFHIIMGIALTRCHVHAHIVAGNTILLAGPWCRDKNERKRIFSYLEEVEEAYGWPTISIKTRLLQTWEADPT